MPTILIVDDDTALRESISETLTDLGHTPIQAADGETALALVAAQKIDAILLDLRMPGPDGMDVLRRLQALPNPPPTAILTAVPTAANTIEAIRLGAVDHLAKPIGRTGLKDLITRLLPPRTPSAQARQPTQDGLIGASLAMRELQKAIGRLADADTTVLITGETGTGKEVVARALHTAGRRAKNPFIAVNCAAIPPDLLESELFGHVRGAFTGATADRQGNFREANHGTLFLDEIGDMPAALQAKILRVLQERVVTPVGGKPTPIDVRILAATHQDLEALVRASRFREDLYWRLGVVPLHLPPLRERPEDIIPLAEHFLGPTRNLSPDAAVRLTARPWPGNVRELRNAIERATTLSRNPTLTADDFNLSSATPPASDLPTAVAQLEINLIRQALTTTKGNRTEAAKILNIHRSLLYEKIKRYNLEPSDNQTDDVRNQDK